ncbi:hypothetical protein DFQ27_007186 [Actinomortierella ambigua]|uniref:Uncharacterized protein n=1 Tax=Actinomortierella ambigua TaxID=1343610 RepID=A0A9P6PVL2_9FUNG|nr:hypothetical protein DFQ27_007186 [Actinomortierella ambigua]
MESPLSEENTTHDQHLTYSEPQRRRRSTLSTIVTYPPLASEDGSADDDDDDDHDDDGDDLEEFDICVVQDSPSDALLAKNASDMDTSTATTANASTSAVKEDEREDDQEESTEPGENEGYGSVSYMELCKRDLQPVEVFLETPLSIQVMLRNHHLAHPFASACLEWQRQHQQQHRRCPASSPSLSSWLSDVFASTASSDTELQEEDFTLFEEASGKDEIEDDMRASSNNLSHEGEGGGGGADDDQATDRAEGGAEGVLSPKSVQKIDHMEGVERAKEGMMVEQLPPSPPQPRPQPQPHGLDFAPQTIATASEQPSMPTAYHPCHR